MATSTAVPLPEVFAIAAGASPLHLAARDGRRAQAESLLGAGAQVREQDDRGYGALHYAARAGHADIIQLLLDHGADVNAESPQEGVATPLELAAEGGHLEAVRRLVANRATVTGEGPLHAARRGGHSAVVALLEPLSPVWARLPSLDRIRFPIENERDPDPEWGDAEGVAPLAYHDGDWWIGVASGYFDEGGASPCDYRWPWHGGRSNGRIWIERLRPPRHTRSPSDSLVRVARMSLALQAPEGEPARCMSQAALDSAFAATLGGLAGRLDPSVIWLLSRRDTFNIPGTPPRRLRYRIERDSSILLNVEGDAFPSERTLLCFGSDAAADERCVIIDTPRWPNYENRVRPLVAAVVRDTVWVFGLRSYGRRIQPAWAAQPIGVVPVFLGRVPLGGVAAR